MDEVKRELERLQRERAEKAAREEAKRRNEIARLDYLEGALRRFVDVMAGAGYPGTALLPTAPRRKGFLGRLTATSSEPERGWLVGTASSDSDSWDGKGAGSCVIFLRVDGTLISDHYPYSLGSGYMDRESGELHPSYEDFLNRMAEEEIPRRPCCDPARAWALLA